MHTYPSVQVAERPGIVDALLGTGRRIPDIERRLPRLNHFRVASSSKSLQRASSMVAPLRSSVTVYTPGMTTYARLVTPRGEAERGAGESVIARARFHMRNRGFVMHG